MLLSLANPVLKPTSNIHFEGVDASSGTQNGRSSPSFLVLFFFFLIFSTNTHPWAIFFFYLLAYAVLFVSPRFLVAVSVNIHAHSQAWQRLQSSFCLCLASCTPFLPHSSLISPSPHLHYTLMLAKLSTKARAWSYSFTMTATTTPKKNGKRYTRATALRTLLTPTFRFVRTASALFWQVSSKSIKARLLAWRTPRHIFQHITIHVAQETSQISLIFFFRGHLRHGASRAAGSGCLHSLVPSFFLFSSLQQAALAASVASAAHAFSFSLSFVIFFSSSLFLTSRSWGPLCSPPHLLPCSCSRPHL